MAAKTDFNDELFELAVHLDIVRSIVPVLQDIHKDEKRSFFERAIAESLLFWFELPRNLRKKRIAFYRLRCALRCVNKTGNSEILFILSLLGGHKWFFLTEMPKNPHLWRPDLVHAPHQINFLTRVPEEHPLDYHI